MHTYFGFKTELVEFATVSLVKPSGRSFRTSVPNHGVWRECSCEADAGRELGKASSHLGSTHSRRACDQDAPITRLLALLALPKELRTQGAA